MSSTGLIFRDDWAQEIDLRHLDPSELGEDILEHILDEVLEAGRVIRAELRRRQGRRQ